LCYMTKSMTVLVSRCFYMNFTFVSLKYKYTEHILPQNDIQLNFRSGDTNLRCDLR
jgi:hypothetical protein